MSEPFVMSIPIEPLAWARARKSGNIFYTHPAMRAFQSTLKFYFRKAVLKHGPLKMVVTFYMVPPKKRVRDLPHVKPDLSNLIKNIEDAANGILYEDDCQIVETHARKIYDWTERRGRIEIKLEEINTESGEYWWQD